MERLATTCGVGKSLLTTAPAMALMACVALILALGPAGAGYERDAARRYSSAIEQYSYSWAALPLLPRRYQNHCGLSDGHYVCADSCGVDYQVYYCSAAAVGCCHVGFGYCDGAGHLRCMSPLF
jgi:hypothetical protein